MINKIQSEQFIKLKGVFRSVYAGLDDFANRTAEQNDRFTQLVFLEMKRGVQSCPICRGIGCVDDGQESMRNLREECPACDGAGRVVYDEDDCYQSLKEREEP